MLEGKTKPVQPMETKLKRIALLSDKNPYMEFKWLMPHFNKENLISCFNELDGKKAVGIDRKTKEEYGKNLEGNIERLIEKMKRMAYRPMPVKEVLIPKDGKKTETRPLGISCIEDKIVQLTTSKILNAIYDPIFTNSSYGFRPGKDCHLAVKAVRAYLSRQQCEVIIDVDLKNFFGKINHKKLTEILRIKIKDERFIRYIVRMLKAGVLSEGELTVSDDGSPQGNVASPVLANIFAHYAIDTWFEETVKNHVIGHVEIFRYADDIVICCRYQSDAERIKKALEGRLEKFSLEINTEKTKVVNFCKNKYGKGITQGSFDFLGFTFYIDRTRKGGITIKVKTSKKKFRLKLQKIKDWCCSNRHKERLKPLWLKFISKVRGHFQYYGVSFNIKMIAKFVWEAVKIFFKWMNRRSQRKSFAWKEFNKFLKLYPLPKVKVYKSLF